jgi:hypothetical protein
MPTFFVSTRPMFTRWSTRPRGRRTPCRPRRPARASRTRHRAPCSRGSWDRRRRSPRPRRTGRGWRSPVRQPLRSCASGPPCTVRISGYRCPWRSSSGRTRMPCSSSPSRALKVTTSCGAKRMRASHGLLSVSRWHGRLSAGPEGQRVHLRRMPRRVGLQRQHAAPGCLDGREDGAGPPARACAARCRHAAPRPTTVSTPSSPMYASGRRRSRRSRGRGPRSRGSGRSTRRAGDRDQQAAGGRVVQVFTGHDRDGRPSGLQATRSSLPGFCRLATTRARAGVDDVHAPLHQVVVHERRRGEHHGEPPAVGAPVRLRWRDRRARAAAVGRSRRRRARSRRGRARASPRTPPGEALLLDRARASGFFGSATNATLAAIGLQA